MSFSVIPSDKFKKEAKRLSKKYPSLKEELAELNDTYKIRLSIKSKGKGKSGGGRIISYVVKDNKEVYLLTIYDKSEFDSIDDKTLKNIIQSLNVSD
jgi:mRNA-degrading endonuclease RelE of RelBE toxin-antitoxin system